MASLTHTLNQSIVCARLCTGPGGMAGGGGIAGMHGTWCLLPAKIALSEGDQNPTQREHFLTPVGTKHA